jgi:hypothetical protein
MLDEAGGNVAVAERRMVEEMGVDAEIGGKGSVSSEEEYQVESKAAA